MDLNPQYSGNDLLIHYGSPLVTAANTVIIPVKTGASGGFEINAVNGADGSVKWTQTTDYILPPHNWTPSFSPVLTPTNRLYFAGAGGTVYYIDNPDSPGATITGHLAFYGINNYTSAGFDNTVMINTPLTSDASGNIYFGFQVTGTNPLNLVSGIARMAPDGTGSWVAAATAAGDTSIIKVVMNNAPALSNDGTKLYVAVSRGNFSSGYLLELNSSDLSTVNKVALKDVAHPGDLALLPDDGTASTTVGPDGDVYFGVLENPFPLNNDRGWLLHFSGDLTIAKTPGAFGWDDTASIVPAAMVSSYQGSSTYLLMTKYNNYAGINTGNGQNKIAVLDPNATEIDAVTGATVMKEVLTILGPTPDPSHPGGVREWCINNAAVDPFTKSILANSEDGKLYRWDLTTNTFTQVVTLTPGIGEAYTPTLIGVDGTVYAINNATLFAVGVNPAVAISSVTQAEGDTGTTTFTFTVSLPFASSQTITVNYATADGNAKAGVDYVAASGTLTFNPGETSKSINVSVLTNTTDEPNETFYVNLTSPTAGTAQGTGTILNDDPHPGISIANASTSEGNSGTKSINFTVTLSAVSGQTITVAYATADGTATVADNDYIAASGTVTFTPGQTSRVISVVIKGDTIVEPDESFSIMLSNPVNVILVRSQAVGKILNDDNAISINDVTLADGASGFTNAVFTVTLSQPSTSTITVNYATSSGTASTNSDYLATSGTLSFAPGQTSLTVPVIIVGNTRNEGNDTFFVNLSNPTNAIISRNKGTGTILNDDPLPSISINDVSLTEGNSGTKNFNFTVSLSAVSGQIISLAYATADNTATTALGDYVAKSGKLNFNPGTTSQTITIVVNGNTTPEPDESFFVNLLSPTNVTLAKAQGVGTIIDDDTQPDLFINSVTTTEGNSGTKTFTFTVTLAGTTTQTVSVDYATADGTATVSAGDYLAKTGTLTFTPGQTSKTISVTVNGNTVVEPDETFLVNLSNPVNARIITGQGVGTILNDDAGLSINDVSLVEGNSGVSPATFTVTLSQASSVPVTVNFATSNGTASSGSDYIATNGTLTFNPGEVSKTVTVHVAGDTLNEANETFFVTLSSSANAVITRSKGTGTIINDDPPPSLSISNVVMTEGNSGTKAFMFTVSLSAPSGQTVSVQYATADNTATVADNDYLATSGTLAFTPGQMTKTITVLVVGDRLVESDESFFVNLLNPLNATLGISQGVGTILNDDGI